GMEEETFPFRGLDGEDPEELDEERRLAYVAITRARRKLTITHAGTRFLFGRTKYLSRSRFIDDLPQDCLTLSGESRPQLSGFTPPRTWQSGAAGSARYDARSDLPAWTSPGGRRAAASISVPTERSTNQGRHVDHDAFDDVPADDFSHPSYEADEERVVRPGQKVSHKKFGVGRVERVESGTPPTVVVRFAGYGPKRIVATFLEFD
ncbi:MAG TPA: 3'-5' exonuclease, partial [Polyangiaceae bacterium]|nr:3'-5' exonuclease [Polyangiaceae bacterium]